VNNFRTKNVKMETELNGYKKENKNIQTRLTIIWIIYVLSIILFIAKYISIERYTDASYFTIPKMQCAMNNTVPYFTVPKTQYTAIYIKKKIEKQIPKMKYTAKYIKKKIEKQIPKMKYTAIYIKKKIEKQIPKMKYTAKYIKNVIYVYLNQTNMYIRNIIV